MCSYNSGTSTRWNFPTTTCMVHVEDPECFYREERENKETFLEKTGNIIKRWKMPYREMSANRSVISGFENSPNK